MRGNFGRRCAPKYGSPWDHVLPFAEVLGDMEGFHLVYGLKLHEGHGGYYVVTWRQYRITEKGRAALARAAE